MLAFHQRGRSAGGSLPFYWIVMGSGFSLSATSTRMETFKKAAACPVITPPCHSSYSAPSGCFYQTLGVGTQGYDTGDGGISAYFIAASCSELTHQLNDCNENVTLETSGWFLQPTRLSPKKIVIHFVQNHQYQELSINVETACQC